MPHHKDRTRLTEVERAALTGLLAGRSLRSVAAARGCGRATVFMALMRLRDNWKVSSNEALVVELERRGYISADLAVLEWPQPKPPPPWRNHEFQRAAGQGKKARGRD